MSDRRGRVTEPTRVLLIVSGGIAAYKAPEIVRALVKDGKQVQVVTTPAAAAFVTELSLATVSGRPVRTTLLDAAAEGSVGHIELADWPDLVLVAPSTADLMARAAAGMANDLASTILLATRAPVLWAPAMNTNMWRHRATRDVLARLAGWGHRFVGPDAGDLACGWIGEGRMIDPPIIAAEVDVVVEQTGGAAESSWRGTSVLVSAGPTRAYLDPVRFLTNASTGTMGFAVAEVAARRGADVTLVAGPVGLATPAGVRRIDVQTADEMLAQMDAVLAAGGVDLVAMVAAVSDFSAASPTEDKLAKDDLLKRLEQGAWVAGVDVLATLVERHGAKATFLGFGAQTVPDEVTEPQAVAAALQQVGEDKLARKGCDALFVNRVGVADTGFSTPTNAGLLLVRRADGSIAVDDAGTPRPKAALAGWMLDRLRDRIGRTA